MTEGEFGRIEQEIEQLKLELKDLEADTTAKLGRIRYLREQIKNDS